MNARDQIMTRIRSALKHTPDQDEDEPILTWQYGQPTSMTDVVGCFIERCADYKAEVTEVDADQIPHAIAATIKKLGITSVVLPPGLDPAWRAAIEQTGTTICEDDSPMQAHELDAVASAVTAAAVAIAETGTIVLDHAANQGRRALTLIPDIHICVVLASQVVSDVPEAVARLRPSVDAGRPLTWISGPSATSDIELKRVEGVHGPRLLIVIVAR
ncbi:MAG: lactate utilization protein C [Propionibacteriaceae bacterium]|jgi:L-lactate dehydrogenase complex protein LldG|nr:lactate utilization protein C [Propionibacteriaceae bacterium]